MMVYHFWFHSLVGDGRTSEQVIGDPARAREVAASFGMTLPDEGPVYQPIGCLGGGVTIRRFGGDDAVEPAPTPRRKKWIFVHRCSGCGSIASWGVMRTEANAREYAAQLGLAWPASYAVNGEAEYHEINADEDPRDAIARIEFGRQLQQTTVDVQLEPQS